MTLCVVNELFTAVEKIKWILNPMEGNKVCKILTDEIRLPIMSLAVPDLPSGL